MNILIPFLEILVIATMLNYLLSFFWNTRSMDLLFGVLAFLIVFAISSLLNLPILYTIITHLINVAAIALLIIFQPELRVALSKLSVKGKRYLEITAFDTFLNQLTSSVYLLSDKRIGALIVLENNDNLNDFSQKSIIVEGKFSSELLETIFATSTPLHDGAVVIKNMLIVAAAVILPLADNTSEAIKSTGTRHRAALGISQATDALAIAVSEESGLVSLARAGVITRGVKPDRFKGVIRSIFTNQTPTSQKRTLFFRKWIKV
jgi:diadenylate cyclase